MNLQNSRVALVSYHAFRQGPYRPSVLHEFFLRRIAANEIKSYTYFCSNWDHLSKSKHNFVSADRVHSISVPGYYKNLSIWRIVSHLAFSIKLLFNRELWSSDLFIICVPPSFLGFTVGLVARLRGKPYIIDVIDLWPEALPVSSNKKKFFMCTLGALWVYLRNLLYRSADELLCHCHYFIQKIDKSPKPIAHYLPLCSLDAGLFSVASNRLNTQTEIRILVLGSINHVLDGGSLGNLLSVLAQKTSKKIILEIIGDGETKADLLKLISTQTPGVEVLDHGVVYDFNRKAAILSRCHFGFNGYRTTTAIGITYKAIDFSSCGIVFLNSVQGDLNDLINTYRAGLNYEIGEEINLATQVLAITEDSFAKMSEGSRKMAKDHFHPDKFEENLLSILRHVGAK